MKKIIVGNYLGFCDFSATVKVADEFEHHSIIMIVSIYSDDMIEVAVDRKFSEALRTILGVKGGFIGCTVEMVKDINQRDVYVMTDLRKLTRKGD